VSFESFGDFLAMGGHGLYVWLSYGLTLAVVVLNVFAPISGRRRYLREQADVERRRQAAEGVGT
jgi:heme exporter protein D